MTRRKTTLQTESKMKRDLLDGMTGLVTLVVIGTVLVMAAGCARVHEHETVVRGNKAIAKDWKPSKRCKTLGKAVTSHVAVLVERNCLRNGLTTVNMMVLNPEKKGNIKGGIAAEHAVQAVTSILGFKPRLAILFYGKTKGKTFFLTAVMESDKRTVAAKR